MTCKLTRSSATLALLLAPFASVCAGEGVLEINQVCAVHTGCFPGDDAGFPVTIDTAGSYRLTSNLSAIEGTDAVRATADGVALDLGGFEVAGPVSCSATLDASRETLVSVDCTGAPASAATGVTGVSSISNGTIRGFSTGVLPARDAILSRLVIRENAFDGIFGQDRSLTMRDLVITTNGDDGIEGQSSSGFWVIADSIIMRNADTGVYLSGGILRNSQVAQNGGDGVRSRIGAGGLVEGCHFRFNLTAIAGQHLVRVSDSVFVGNGTNINGGTSAGDNLCDGSAC